MRGLLILLLIFAGLYWLGDRHTSRTAGTAQLEGSARATLLAIQPYLADNGALHAQATVRNNADEEMAHIQIECACASDRGPFSEGGGSAPNVPARATVKTDVLCWDKPNGKHPRMECRIGDILPASTLRALDP